MTIQTANGYEFVIDEEDVKQVLGYEWTAYCSKRRDDWKISRIAGGRRVLLWRQLLNAPVGMFVDHVDGDIFNNQRSNLRLATQAQNSRNRRMSKVNSVGFKGVRRRGHTFRAIIAYEGKVYRQYGFKTAREAAIAYNEMALKYHGEFARLNVV